MTKWSSIHMKKHLEFNLRRTCSFPVGLTDTGDRNETRRECAYKALMIMSLSLTMCSWACLSTAIPMVHQFITMTNDQFNSVLEFCEDTAATTSQESTIVLDEFLKQTGGKGLIYGNFSTLKDRLTRQVQVQSLPPGFHPHLNIHECRCDPLPGPKGPPGRPGLKGVTGTTGAPGKPARLPCQPLIDFKKYCPESCPGGPQGAPGSRGHSGEKGAKGPIGVAGKNGEDGNPGIRGPTGVPGLPGTDGDEGDAGVDAIPSPFVPGPAGPTGETGEVGPQGPRGMPGIDGPQGPMGRRGEGGRNGLPGQRGQPGPIGIVGDPGDDGHQGVCPTYCAGDGGVFFVEPPDWFFKDR